MSKCQVPFDLVKNVLPGKVYLTSICVWCCLPLIFYSDHVDLNVLRRIMAGSSPKHQHDRDRVVGGKHRAKKCKKCFTSKFVFRADSFFLFQEVNVSPESLKYIWYPELEIYGLEKFGRQRVLKEMSGVRIRKNKTINYELGWVMILVLLHWGEERQETGKRYCTRIDLTLYSCMMDYSLI